MSAIATAACPAAGRSARHRATCGGAEGVIAMRRFAVIAALGAVLSMTTASAAGAAGPEHFRSTFSAKETVPAGQLCDFTYHNEFTMTTNSLVFPDGRQIDQGVINAAHTNVDT